DFQRRQQSGVASLTLGVANSFRFANQIYVAGCEQLNDALVESEVLDGILNFAVLNIPDAIACKSSLQRGAWIDAANIPEATEQYAAIHRLDHVVKAGCWLRTFDDAVDWTRRRLFAFLL